MGLIRQELKYKKKHLILTVTFPILLHYQTLQTQKKADNFPYPGIGPIGTQDESNELIYHNYYMWVPYLLLFQSTTFFIPLLLHRFWQEGKVQLLLDGLHNLISYDETRIDKYGDIKFYFRDWWNCHNWWAYKLFFCDFLNLVNIVVNILLINW